MPSFEVGWGGAGSEGVYAPLTGGEGLGNGTQGWGLGLQGRYVRGGWAFATTLLALRDHGHTSGILQRAALAYQAESGWRLALEQTPFAWGSGLNGGDLLGDAARPFPRLSVSTPEVDLALSRWRLEAFAGRIDRTSPIPLWLSDREARILAQSDGLALQNPILWGGLLKTALGSLVETSLGAVSLRGGRDAQGHQAPGDAARTRSLAEARVRIPSLAQWLGARGASVYTSRSSASEGRSLALAPGRGLGGLQVVWEGWDLGLEYAGATPIRPVTTYSQPAYLADFSFRGDSLGAAFGSGAITRTMELGLPFFFEGQGRIKAVRLTSAMDRYSSSGAWFLQGEAQWRTSTGRAGASVASRRDSPVASALSWGWSFSVFQAFRVF
jgi:hypothetical protein